MAQSRRRVHFPPAPTVDWLLVDPGFFPNGVAQGSRATAGGATHEGLAGVIATRDNSGPHEVKFRPDVKFKFCFQSRGGTLVLDTGCLEIADPYGVRPIKLWPEVLATHYQLVLFRICGSPTCFFVYGFPCTENAKVVEVPKIPPEIWSSRSFGILRDESESDKFVVANLKIGRNEAFLDRWWHSSSWSSASGRRERVTLPSDMIIKMGKWSTDKVLSCSNFRKSHDVLLFVDLRQGIIVCHNALKEENASQFEFIHLPHVKRVRVRHEALISVAWSNGKLKFVSLDISDVNKLVVSIVTFDGLSWQQTSRFPLRFPLFWDLWAARNIQGFPSSRLLKMHIPCFPVLSTNEDHILYLVLASEDKKHAWLLQVNTESKCLERAAEYPGFWNHQKPPFSINRF